MPRPLRQIAAGVCYHVLNRGNDRQTLFHKPQDFQAFIAIIAEAAKRFDVDLLCWCVMSNHWHMVVRPRKAPALADFMRWLTITHVRRHHGHYAAKGGHLYQGRYKSFPVQDDAYFLVLCRYVEANPLHANLVARAERWEWSSLWQRRHRTAEPRLTEWPVQRPADWTAIVNEAMTQEQVKASLERDRPLGSESGCDGSRKSWDLSRRCDPSAGHGSGRINCRTDSDIAGPGRRSGRWSDEMGSDPLLSSLFVIL